MMSFSYDFLHALGRPEITAQLKREPEDFKVNEKLGFELSGAGEHLCVLIEKTGLNTNEVVKILSRHYHIPARQISYAGLKDRQAVTRQWFSLSVGLKRELDFTTLLHPALKVLEVSRNSKKIRRGTHAGNNFCIRLKNVEGDLSGLEEKIVIIKKSGIPNYFGHQRFGRKQDNVDQALKMFNGEVKIKDRFLRGMYLSAARSWLFNHCLSERVKLGNWDSYLNGDVMALQGSSSYFVPEEWDASLQTRLSSLDIHPSGPLWGKGELESLHQTKVMENSLLKTYPELCNGLIEFGLSQERRALRLCPDDLQIYPEGQSDLVVEFGLGKGAYATSLLRELVTIN